MRNEAKFYEITKQIDNLLTSGFTQAISNNLLKVIEEDGSYENYFFKKVESIEWFYLMKEKGYFSPNSAPAPKEAEQEGSFSIPEWNVLSYLERVSEQVNVLGNEKYIDELVSIIKEVTQYHIKHDKILDNYRTWWYFVKILLNLPNNKISIDTIELTKVWLDSRLDNMLPGSDIATKLLPKFLNTNNTEDWKKAEKIVEIITDIRWIPLPEERSLVLRKTEEPKTVLETYWLEKSFKVNAPKIGERCSENIIFTLADRLKEILMREYKDQPNDYSYIWFDSLYSEPTVYEAKEILTAMLRDIVLAKAKTDKSVAGRVMDRFLSNEYQYPLFRRIALFVIGNQWDDYKSLFWEIIDEDKIGELFDASNYRPEVYELLQKNVRQFTPDEKRKIKIIINRGPQRYLPEENQERYIAYWKQKWYSALKSEPYFVPLYKKQKKITQTEEELSFREPKVRLGPGPSPLTKEDILKMANGKLADYLSTFKEKDPWKGPTGEGLADTLKAAAQKKPEKFIDDLSPFLNTDYRYVYEILWGIRDAWNEKKIINWGKLLEFIKQYIDRNGFWKDKLKVKGDILDVNHLWVTGMAGELIQEGTKDDSWAFSEDYFQAAKEIIFLILEKQQIKEKEEIRDHVTYALNSSFGKAITALIYLALHIARIENKKGTKKEVKWESEIKNKYEDILQRGIVEGFILLGQYLPNLYYLDKKWVEGKIGEIAVEENKIWWEAFMDGYLFGGRVYENLFKLMKQHYSVAIDYDFKEKHSARRLIQHICIGYLRGDESIKNKESLIRKVLDKWEHPQASEIIKFFWMQRDSADRDIKEKIISFWRWIYENKYKDRQEQELSDEDKKILADLSRLTVFLPKIDSENFKWLMLSASYIYSHFNYPFFVEYLDKFEDEEIIGYIGKIVMKMSLLAPSLADYKKEHIQSIVEKLYKIGKKEEADEICNEYGSRGLDFLRDIYEKHNAVQ